MLDRRVVVLRNHVDDFHLEIRERIAKRANPPPGLAGDLAARDLFDGVEVTLVHDLDEPLYEVLVVVAGHHLACCGSGKPRPRRSRAYISIMKVTAAAPNAVSIPPGAGGAAALRRLR